MDTNVVNRDTIGSQIVWAVKINNTIVNMEITKLAFLLARPSQDVFLLTLIQWIGQGGSSILLVT